MKYLNLFANFQAEEREMIVTYTFFLHVHLKFLNSFVIGVKLTFKELSRSQFMLLPYISFSWIWVRRGFLND